MFGSKRTLNNTSDLDEISRKMNILEGGGGGTSTSSGCESDDVLKAHVLVSDLEDVISKQKESTSKIEDIKKLIELAKEAAKYAGLQRTIDEQKKQLELVKQSRGMQMPGEAPRQVSFKRHSTGLYISHEDANIHPLIKSTSLVKMILILLAVILIVQPFFIAISADVQTMSIAFFVLILLIGGFAALNFFETREQELRMFFGDCDNAAPENREVKLNYSLAAFAATMFSQLVYALMSARTAVSMVVVAFVTLASCIALFCSYGFLVGFENKYVVAE